MKTFFTLDRFPQINTAHPDPAYRIMGWVLPIADEPINAFKVPRQIGVMPDLLRRLDALETLNRRARALGYRSASHAMHDLEAALNAARKEKATS